MKKEDQDRLNREAEIAKATRGPDYSRVEKEINNAKSEQAAKDKSGREYEARQARIAAIAKREENSFSKEYKGGRERE